MNDEKKDFEWNPPSPPWQSEPEPLSLRVTPDEEPEPEPVNTGLEEKIEEMVEDGDLKIEASTDTDDVELEEFTEDVPLVLFNGKLVTEESNGENGTEFDGFFFYRIKCATGITLNGKHFAAGAYWFDEATFESMEIIDKPFQ